MVSIAFGERGSAESKLRLAEFGFIHSANLLEAELLATLKREGAKATMPALERVIWVIPDRPLHAEIRKVLSAGYLRGADCWHLAAALYVAVDPGNLTFLTLDTKQAAVAKALGFST